MSISRINQQQRKKFLYLLVGFLNTIVGYLLVVGITILSPPAQLFYVALCANFLAISFSFLTYKLFVFRVSGYWLRQYLRAFIVYGGASLIGTILLWVLTVGFGIAIWAAQGLVVIFTILISYIGHNRFTFVGHLDK